MVVKMSEERFRVRFEQEDGRGEIVNEKGVELTAREVVDLLNKQQATIRKLQDLCGESDSENARLRLKSKELQEEIKLLKPTNIEQYEQIVQLQEENEALKKFIKDNFDEMMDSKMVIDDG